MTENISKIFDFLHIVENLKDSIRFSECIGMPRESTAEHTWRLTLMTFIIADELKLDIDILKSLKIAIVHDLPEAIIGDIDSMKIASGKITKEEKNKMEVEAIKKIVSFLPEKIGKEILDLWEDYEYSKSKEALFVKALDKIETLIHMIEREWSVKGHENYQEGAYNWVARYADKHVKNFPELKNILKYVKKNLREEFKKGGFEWKSDYDEVFSEKNDDKRIC